MMCWSISSQAGAKYRLLYVGADLGLLEFVREALKGEGWFVVRCAGGSVARLLLRSEIRYDLLMFDEDLTEGSGMELARLARSLEHRKRTPIILLLQKERWGVARASDEGILLRKPEPFHAVVDAVRCLLG
jgi:DNA-binding response OmpR family regulator